MAEQYPQVNCPLFLEIEWDIRELIEDINQFPNLLDKRDQAETIMDKAQMLLSCSQYKDIGFDCAKCRRVADLHQRVAHLLIKAQEVYRFIHARHTYC